MADPALMRQATDLGRGSIMATIEFYTRDGIPTSRPYTEPAGAHADYTDAPVAFRVVDDGVGAETWVIDGVDASGRHTEACRFVATHDEAVASVPEFARELA